MLHIEYDKEARGWNTVDQDGQICGMFRSRKAAERSAELSNRLTRAWGG